MGPAVEVLEDRLVLTGAAPTNPVPPGPAPGGVPNPQTLGAAYQQVVAIEGTTLQSVGDAYREVQAAGTQFVSHAGDAIAGLNAELRQGQGAPAAHPIDAAIRRDRDVLNVAEGDAAREQHGLDVAVGGVAKQANTDEIDIPDGLFTSLAELVQQDQSTNSAFARSAQRSAAAFLSALDTLSERLTSAVSAPGAIRNVETAQAG